VSIGRIYFPGNPWPTGHALIEFQWTCKRVDANVWFDFHIKSADYYAETVAADDAAITDDWTAPGVWGNYHACILSSTYWGAEGGGPRGIKVCPVEAFDPAGLHDVVLEADPLPLVDWDDARRSFQIYLLGHDTVAGHCIRFVATNQPEVYDIVWTGRAALTYAGRYGFDYEFRAEVFGVRAPTLDSGK
jgi:hypothetical protein